MEAAFKKIGENLGINQLSTSGGNAYIGVGTWEGDQFFLLTAIRPYYDLIIMVGFLSDRIVKCMYSVSQNNLTEAIKTIMF